MTRRARVVVAGAAHWHFPLYRQALVDLAPRVEVVAVTDPDPEVARAATAVLGGAALADLTELPDGPNPDLGIVLGRHDTMDTHARWFVERSVPFLLEKPGGLDLTRLRALVAAAAGLPVVVPLVHRWAPFASMLSEIPAPRHISISYLAGPPSRYPAARSGWMLDPAAGGGLLNNLGPHFVDLAGWLGGGPVRVRAATVDRVLHGLAIEDHAHLVLGTADGSSVAVELGYVFPHSPTKRHVHLTVADRTGFTAVLPDGTVQRTAAGGDITSARIDLDSDVLFAPFLGRVVDTLDTGFVGLPGLPDLLRAMEGVDTATRLATGRGWGGSA